MCVCVYVCVCVVKDKRKAGNLVVQLIHSLQVCVCVRVCGVCVSYHFMLCVCVCVCVVKDKRKAGNLVVQLIHSLQVCVCACVCMCVCVCGWLGTCFFPRQVFVMSKISRTSTSRLVHFLNAFSRSVFGACSLCTYICVLCRA